MTQVFFDPRQFVAGQQVQRDTMARNALADLAPAAIQGNENALAQLAQYAPEMAMDIQDRAEQRAIRNQNMDLQRERLNMERRRLSQQEEAQARAIVEAQTAEEREVAQTALRGALLGAQTNNPGMYAAAMADLQRLDPDMAPIPMEMFPEVAHTFEGMSQVYADMPVEEPVKPMSGPGKVQADIDAGFLPDGTPLRSSGVTVNTGDQVDTRPQIGTIPQGYQAIFDEQANSWNIEPIPGSEAARDIAAAEQKSERTQSTERLKLGTSLQNIQLNLNAAEGWLPVTGAIGDARRTGVGRALTGSGAMDVQNRTDQITDSAALAELQRMRDNSPTGGAVGALTDGERVAIGNAVTGINTATGEEEYIRALEVYRNLMLDLAYGEGAWQLSEDGMSVTVRSTQAPDQGSPALPFRDDQDRLLFEKYGVGG